MKMGISLVIWSVLDKMYYEWSRKNRINNGGFEFVSNGHCPGLTIVVAVTAKQKMQNKANFTVILYYTGIYSDFRAIDYNEK